MSTDHQKYSLLNQAEAIATYAGQAGIQIVKTYSDAGKSGLRTKGRDALNLLIDDVQHGTAGFEFLLVYDVSRWGRYQDSDAAAYYEYICRKAGVRVIYCAEQFANDGSPMSNIIKNIKRAMAAEYSRELSVKISRGQRKVAQFGFRPCGPAGFGLRRMLVDEHGRHRQVLSRGERKTVQTDRIILVPGPDWELAIVREIFQWFAVDGYSESGIADMLNARGVLSDRGVRWRHSNIHSILENEKYIGNNVYGRTSFKLKGEKLLVDPSAWVRVAGAFEAIVDEHLFRRVQDIIATRYCNLDKEQMLHRLRDLFERRGNLTRTIIAEDAHTPAWKAYVRMFGGLLVAYELIGFTPGRDHSSTSANSRKRWDRTRAAFQGSAVADAPGDDADDSQAALAEAELASAVLKADLKRAAVRVAKARARLRAALEVEAAVERGAAPVTELA